MVSYEVSILMFFKRNDNIFIIIHIFFLAQDFGMIVDYGAMLLTFITNFTVLKNQWFYFKKFWVQKKLSKLKSR